MKDTDGRRNKRLQAVHHAAHGPREIKRERKTGDTRAWGNGKRKKLDAAAVTKSPTAAEVKKEDDMRYPITARGLS